MSTINPINVAERKIERSYQGSALTRTVQFCKDANSRERHEIFMIVKTISVRTLAGCVSGGVVAGALVGGLAGGPPGILTGAAIGGTVGLTLGIGVASAKSCIKIRSSVVYKNWKDNAIQRGVYEQFVKFFNTQDRFKEFICSVSHAIPEIPVRAPCGHTYNKESIEGWLKVKPPEAHACPSRALATFSKDDLEYDINFVRRIVDLSREIFENDTQEAAEYRKFVGEGMESYIENLKENHLSIAEQTLGGLGRDLLRASVSHEFAGKALGALYESFILKMPPSPPPSPS